MSTYGEIKTDGLPNVTTEAYQAQWDLIRFQAWAEGRRVGQHVSGRSEAVEPDRIHARHVGASAVNGFHNTGLPEQD